MPEMKTCRGCSSSPPLKDAGGCSSESVVASPASKSRFARLFMRDAAILAACGGAIEWLDSDNSVPSVLVMRTKIVSSLLLLRKRRRFLCRRGFQPLEMRQDAASTLVLAIDAGVIQ